MVLRCSVIIPTCNRASQLHECLESVLKQNFDPLIYEIIVVDDGSTDDTSVVVTEFQKVYPDRIVYLPQKNGGCARARNVGIQQARASLLFFTDDDCIVPPNWIEKHIEAHEQFPEAAGVGGWYFPKSGTLAQNRYNQLYELLFDTAYPMMRDLTVHTNMMGSPAGNTANVSYKRWCLEQVGGFDERLYFTGGVDWELKARLIASNLSIVSIPLHVTHQKEFTWFSFAAKCIRNGRGMDYRVQKYAHLPDLETSDPFMSIAQRVVQMRSMGGNYTKISSTFLLMQVCYRIGRYTNRIMRFRPHPFPVQRGTDRFVKRYIGTNLISRKHFLPYLFLARHLQTTTLPGSTDYTLHVQEPFCSVVIPVFNRGDMIKEVVRAVLSQSVHKDRFELIIVDDGSTDDTAHSIREVQKKYSDRTVRYVHQENTGPSGARNRGASEARGDIIFFLDSDCVPPKDWIYSHLEAYYQHSDLAAVGGGVRTTSPVAHSWDLHRNSFFANSFPLYHPYTLLMTNDLSADVLPYNTANLSLRSEVFRAIDGFTTTDDIGRKPAHEDVEFAYRIQKAGHLMALIPTYVVDIRLMTIEQFRKMARLRGQLLPALLKRFDHIPQQYKMVPNLEIVLLALMRALIWPTGKRWSTFVFEQERFEAYDRAMETMRASEKQSE